MIALIRGRLRRKHDDRVVVDAAGVGYEIVLPPVVQQAISGALNDRLIGREVEVLVEGPARRERRPGSTSTSERGAGQLFGKSAHFKTVVFGDDGTPAGTLRRVRVMGATALTLIGEPVAHGAPVPLPISA